MVFDIQQLSAIDSAGEEVLRILSKRGGRFITNSLYGRDLCKRLKLSRVTAPDSENHQRNGECPPNPKNCHRARTIGHHVSPGAGANLHTMRWEE